MLPSTVLPLQLCQGASGLSFQFCFVGFGSFLKWDFTVLEIVPGSLVDSRALGIVLLSAFEPEVIELHAKVLPKSSSEGQVGFPGGFSTVSVNSCHPC